MGGKWSSHEAHSLSEKLSVYKKTPTEITPTDIRDPSRLIRLRIVWPCFGFTGDGLDRYRGRIGREHKSGSHNLGSIFEGIYALILTPSKPARRQRPTLPKVLGPGSQET